jgi:hydrogenase nickel incorporation protein HypA/HybF
VHELSITQSVVDAVTRRMGDARIRRVRLEVGKLSGLVPDAVQFCFEVVAAGHHVRRRAGGDRRAVRARAVPHVRPRVRDR